MPNSISERTRACEATGDAMKNKSWYHKTVTINPPSQLNKETK